MAKKKEQSEVETITTYKGFNKDFVVDQGADISAQPFENETLRFKFNGVFGIVWTSGTGNLLAHDFGNKFYKEASV